MKTYPYYLTIKIRRWFTNKWLYIPLIDRWLINELIPPLFFAIAAFTVVSLSVGVVFDLVRQIVEMGIPFTIAFKVLLFRLPSFLVISFPMAMLLASLLTYGRLNENSELKALRSIGINTYRMVLPALTLALFMTCLTFLFNNNIVPYSNRSAEDTISVALGKAFTSEQGEDIIYSQKGYIVDPNTNLKKRGVTHLFYAWKFIEGEMIDVTVIDFSKLGYTQMLKAKSGKWNESESKWEFLDGNLLTLADKGSSTSTEFKSFISPLGIELSNVATLPKDSRDMTLSEAIIAKKRYEQSGNIKETRRIKVRIQEKITLPFACLVFALIGSSFGSSTNRKGGRSQGFGFSIILILIYYILSFSFSSLGVKGIIEPSISAWIPIFISMIGGGILLRQSSK